MSANLFIGILCGVFSVAFGIWLFEYILRRARKTEEYTFSGNIKLYAVSITFILIGVGLIFATIMSVSAD